MRNRSSNFMPSATPDQSSLRLWRNARLATMASGIGAPADVTSKAAILVRGDRIVHAGAESDLPAFDASACETLDCEGRWITPGLIDCHTHLVHAGNRAKEFEMRLNGASYQEIAAAGGGRRVAGRHGDRVQSGHPHEGLPNGLAGAAPVLRRRASLGTAGLFSRLFRVYPTSPCHDCRSGSVHLPRKNTTRTLAIATLLRTSICGSP